VAGGLKLTIYLQLMPRSRKRGSIHPLPVHLHGVVPNNLSTGTNLPFLPLNYFTLKLKRLKFPPDLSLSPALLMHRC
jgi:hypothetical protein